MAVSPAAAMVAMAAVSVDYLNVITDLRVASDHMAEAAVAIVIAMVQRKGTAATKIEIVKIVNECLFVATIAPWMVRPAMSVANQTPSLSTSAIATIGDTSRPRLTATAA